jgi:hypothetical protein
MTWRAADGRSAVRVAWLTCLVTALTACATWQEPVDMSDASLRARAVTETKRGVALSAAVLDADDSVRMFGTDVTAAGIQPVWIEVRNGTDQVFWLLRSGTDPDYFSPLEVAWSTHVKLGGATNARIDEHFDRLAFPNPIPAHGVSSGILFTNPQPVTKLLNVDLLGNKTMLPFTLFLPVRGDGAQAGDQIHRYASSEITRYDDLAALRRTLESLPCCASTGEDGAAGGPLNVVLVGDLDDIGAAFVRRGYRRNSTGVGPAQRVFGRPPDFELSKRAQAGAPANWIRLWRAPIDHRGQFVFVAQTGRPVGGRFLAERARDVRLHPDVDEVRNFLISDFMYSGGLEKLAFVSGTGAVPVDHPRHLAGGESYYTDGRRAVLFLGTRPLTISDVEVLDWEPLSSERAAEAAGQKELYDGGHVSSSP